MSGEGGYRDFKWGVGEKHFEDLRGPGSGGEDEAGEGKGCSGWGVGGLGDGNGLEGGCWGAGYGDGTGRLVEVDTAGVGLVEKMLAETEGIAGRKWLA